MREYLALPAWNTLGTTMDAWVKHLSDLAGPVVVTRESPSVTWLEVAPIRLRGYVVVENGRPSAINFEVDDLDQDATTRAIESAAQALGWEIHPDSEDDETEDDEN